VAATWRSLLRRAARARGGVGGSVLPKWPPPPVPFGPPEETRCVVRPADEGKRYRSPVRRVESRLTRKEGHRLSEAPQARVVCETGTCRDVGVCGRPAPVRLWRLWVRLCLMNRVEVSR